MTLGTGHSSHFRKNLIMEMSMLMIELMRMQISFCWKSATWTLSIWGSLALQFYFWLF